MKMADLPSSVVHRIRDDGEEEADHDPVAQRNGRPRVAAIELYLRQHGHATAYDIAAAGLMSEDAAGQILTDLKTARRVHRVDRVRVPCKPGSDRPRKQTRYVLAEKFKA